MVYGNTSKSEEDLLFIVCDKCKTKTLFKDVVEWYDKEDLITGWDGQPTPRLKTYCKRCSNG